MLLKLRFFVLPLFCLPSSFGLAANVSDGTYEVLSSIRVTPNGHTFNVFRANGSNFDPANCDGDNDPTTAKYPQVTKNQGNGVTADAYDQFFAVALAAQISGKEVRLWISDFKCSGASPSISYIEVR